MGNPPRSSGLNAFRRAELETRFRELDDLIVWQKQALKELGQCGAASVAVVNLLHLLEREQAAVIEDLGYNPRAN